LALRIAFDLDGVLADMESELVRQAEAIFGEVMTRKLQERAEARQPPAETDAPNPSPDDAAETNDAGDLGEPGEQRQALSSGSADSAPSIVKLDMTARQERRVWRHVAGIEDFWVSLNEIEPGVVSRLAGIAADRRWEIIFLTKRPQTAGATAQVQSQRWLESKGFVLPSVYVVQGSRGRIAAALGLDIVIDDRPENCLDVVVDSKARAILVWRGDEKALPVAARRLGIGVVKSVGECLDILTELDAPSPHESGVLARVRRMLGLQDAKPV
jgi:hypothetical protein